MTKLTFLTLQANKLSKVEHLDKLVNLKELYLSQNFIEKMEGLSTLTKLEILDMANNRISKIEGIENLSELTDLWLNNNKIADDDDLKMLVHVPKVTTIYLWKNPIARDGTYKQKVRQYLKNCEDIN